MPAEQASGQFLVNGIRCELSLDSLGFSWRPTRGCGNNRWANDEKINDTSKRAKRVDFAQVIQVTVGKGLTPTGAAPASATAPTAQKGRIKIYFARQLNQNKTLLRVKKLSIEILHVSRKTSTQSERYQPLPSPGQRGVTKQAQGDEIIKEQKLMLEVTNEGPPSCYASEGSTGHLSSLSSASLSNGSSSITQRAELAEEQEQATNSPLDLDQLARRLDKALELRRKERPKRLLVFVNPFGGKGKATGLYKTQVRRLLELADIEAKLVVTKYANHARDTVEDPNFNVEYYDGVVCVGGDGMFSELMNGLLFRYNRDKLLTSAALRLVSNNYYGDNEISCDNERIDDDNHQTASLIITDNGLDAERADLNQAMTDNLMRTKRQLKAFRSALGGVGKQFVSPPIPIGVIGAGSTDANSFGLIGTNDVITATLNIVLGNKIKIDVCSVHSIEEDDLLRFVSTFVAYGYFGDVIRESERLRWLGPSRYDVTGVNNLIKNRSYEGKVKILVAKEDGSPQDLNRCHINCKLCQESLAYKEPSEQEGGEQEGEERLQIVEERGPFIGVNAAVTACRCPQTKKGFSPNNHLANGCADLILVKPCSRMQYIHYLLRTGWTKKSAFDLKYVEAFRCRQFEFIASKLAGSQSSGVSTSGCSSVENGSSSNSNSLDSKHCQQQLSQQASSWNVDGEILNEQSIRVKVNNKLLRVFGTGEPQLIV